MKISNQEIVNVIVTLGEMLNCKEAKQKIEDKESKVPYAMYKNYNAVKKPYKIVVGKEQELKEALANSLAEEGVNADSVKAQNKKDVDAFFDAEEHEITFHKISMAHANVFADYLSGPATIAMYNFLTMIEEEKEEEEKTE